MTESYYELLEVDPTASTREIEQAYREAVKQYHPDKNDDPGAKAVFIRLQEARSTLTDPEERATYDREHGFDYRSGTAEGTENHHQQSQDHQSQSPTETDERHTQRDPSAETQNADSDDTTDRVPRWQRTNQWTTAPAWVHTWIERYNTSLNTTIGWISVLVGIVFGFGSSFLALVRSPRSRFPNRSQVRTVLTSPAGVPFCVTIGIMIVLTIIAHYFGYPPRESTGVGVAIVTCSLIVSYASYDLVSSRTEQNRWVHRRFKPAGRPTLWPIAVTNLFGVALVILGLMGGAPFGGLLFTALLALPFAIPLLYYNGGLPVWSRVLRRAGAPVPRLSVPNAHRYRSMVSAVLIGLLLFTRLGFSTTELLDSQRLVGVTPWFLPLSIGPVSVGLLLNFLVGLCMYACLLWSMYAMVRYLIVAPWTDRYDHGYGVRPGPWNLLIAGPFVLFGWMVVTGVPTISIPFGLLTISLTQADFMVGLFLLPSVATVLYLLRRHIELMRRLGDHPF